MSSASPGVLIASLETSRILSPADFGSPSAAIRALVSLLSAIGLAPWVNQGQSNRQLLKLCYHPFHRAWVHWNISRCRR